MVDFDHDVHSSSKNTCRSADHHRVTALLHLQQLFIRSFFLRRSPLPIGRMGKKRASLQDKISEHFTEHGFSAADVPKAIVVHEMLGIAMLALTWSTCYHFPPSQNRYLKAPIASLMNLIPKKLSGPVASNTFLSSKLGSSYLESSCLRKLIRPMTFPSKLYVTFKL
ncbi:hypothetical protein B484DRAFT_427448, partial [Ochromonadaceae sp. CCMP2298]